MITCKCYHADKNFLGEIGVCWGTKECEPCSCGGDEAKCDFYDYVRERVKKPITNADKIRQMSDEKLADYAGKHFGCHPAASREICRGVADCAVCWLDWLKQEVESNG